MHEDSHCCWWKRQAIVLQRMHVLPSHLLLLQAPLLLLRLRLLLWMELVPK
jgi:hypothetical protein